jgi:hypothetical protein
MRTFVTSTLMGGVLLSATTASAGNDTIFDLSTNPVTVAVYGDAPYGTKQGDNAQVQATPAFIASVNADKKVALVLHVGDIHSGKQFCTEACDRTVFNLWTAFKDPLIYTRGDNEWSDCHKVGEGGGVYNPTTGQSGAGTHNGHDGAGRDSTIPPGYV